MKRVTIMAVCLLTVLCSCNKNNTNTTSQPQQNQNPATVNSTEQQLIGTWLQDQMDVAYDDSVTAQYGDTSFTGYSSACHLKFTTDRFDPDHWTEQYKTGEDAICKNLSGPTTPGVQPIYWFYDTGVSMLKTGSVQYTIVTLTSTQLVIRYHSTGITTTFHFHK